MAEEEPFLADQRRGHVQISLLPVLHRSPSIQSLNSLLRGQGRGRDGHGGDTHN
jgi:hypothetical protein